MVLNPKPFPAAQMRLDVRQLKHWPFCACAAASCLARAVWLLLALDRRRARAGRMPSVCVRPQKVGQHITAFKCNFTVNTLFVNPVIKKQSTQWRKPLLSLNEDTHTQREEIILFLLLELLLLLLLIAYCLSF